MNIEAIGQEKEVVEAVKKEILSRHCFDYDKQVWIKDGVYVRCGHPDSMNCHCYGKDHAGETAVITEHCG